MAHKHNKNNFKNASNTARCKYRLWIALKPEFQKEYGNKKTLVMYGFMTKPDAGLEFLKNQADLFKDKSNALRLYDNLSPNTEPLIDFLKK